MKPIFSIVCVATIALLCGLAQDSLAKKERPANTKNLLKREETMVFNLSQGNTSAKYFLLHSLRSTRDMQKEIYKATRQVETVDASYAKARQRPDDRTMTGTIARLKKVQSTLEQLEKELEAANTELKSDIQNTLIRQAR